jgi:hypothetical protein
VLHAQAVAVVVDMALDHLVLAVLVAELAAELVAIAEL